MGIISRMATVTGHRGRAESLVLVTIGTGNFLMFSQQRIVSCVVVKTYVGPLSFIVTVSTFSAGEAIVYVIIEVAGHTFGRRVSALYVGFMAICTNGIDVTPKQRVVGEIVVKRVLVERYDREVAAFMIGVAACAGAGLCVAG